MTNWFSYPDAPSGNVFGSDPGYDEAYGPHSPEHSFQGGISAPTRGRAAHYLWNHDHNKNPFVPLDEVANEVVAIESIEDRERRLYWQDPDEPLGPNETEDSVRGSMQDTSLLIFAEPGHQANLGPAKVAVRRFNGVDVLPTKRGTAVVRIKIFSRRIGRLVPAESRVRVNARRCSKRSSFFGSAR